MKNNDAFQVLLHPEMMNFKEQFQVVFDNLACAFTIFNTIKNEKDEIIDFTFYYVNNQAQIDLEVDQNKILGKKLTEIFTQRSDDLVKKCIQVLNDGNPQKIEFSFNGESIHKQNLRKTFEANIVKVNDNISLSWKDVTAYKEKNDSQKVEALRKEKRFRSTFDNMMEGCAIIDLNWNYLYVNKVYASYIHLEPEDLIGKNMLELIPGVEKSEFFECYKRCIIENTLQHVEARFTFADGSSAWYHTIAQPAPEGIFSISMDITERKKSEEERDRLFTEIEKRAVEAEDGRQMLNALMEYVPVGITIAEAPDIKLRLVSRFGTELLGGKHTEMTAEEVAAQWAVYYTDGNTPMPNEELPLVRAIVKGEMVRNLEVVQKNSQGDRLWLLCNAGPIYDKSGNITAGIVAWDDITERKKAEETLRIREAQLDAFFANSPINLQLFDERFCYINLDKQTASYYNKTREELIGKSLEDFVPQQISKYKESIQHTMETGEVITSEQSYPMPGKPGEMLHWLTTQFRVPIGNGKWGHGQISVEITGIKNAEEKLQESEERFRNLADNISQLAWMADNEGWIFWYNKRWYDYTGTTFDEMQGWGWKLVHHPDHIDNVIKNWTNALKEGKSWEDIFPLKSKDGEFRWFLSRALPIYDDSGKILRWFGTNTDITEQRKAEDTLRESEERFRTLADNISQLAWMADRSGSLFWYNKRWYDYTGTTFDEMQGWGWSKVHHPDHIDNVIVNWTNALKVGKSWEDIFPLKSKEGEFRWFLSRALPIYDDSGKILRWFGTNTDITEQRKAEDTLRESEERFRTLADNISQLAWMANQNGWIFWYNKRWYDYTGTTFDEMQGWGWSKVHHPDHIDNVIVNWTNALKVGKSWEDIFPLKSKDGEYRWFLSRALPIYDDSGKILKWFGTNTDITEKREAMLKLESTLKELERSNADLEQIVFAASHDLQEPIRMMGSYAQLISKNYKGKLDTKADIYLDYMFEGAKRLQFLVKDLLNYSRLRTSEKKIVKINLKEIINQVLGDFRTTIADSNAQINVNSLPEIVADHSLMKQLFSNLISNALKFKKEDIAPIINIAQEDKETEWLFSIKDNGIGIKPEYLDTIFIAFKRLNDREIYPGVGFGLAISKRIVERHNGRIWVESQPGIGSIFYFTIPKQKEKDGKE